jgi:hypothetical protein
VEGAVEQCRYLSDDRFGRGGAKGSVQDRDRGGGAAREHVDCFRLLKQRRVVVRQKQNGRRRIQPFRTAQGTGREGASTRDEQARLPLHHLQRLLETVGRANRPSRRRQKTLQGKPVVSILQEEANRDFTCRHVRNVV